MSYSFPSQSRGSVRSGETFLHGYLIIGVNSARGLPDMENWFSKLYDKKDVTDPFVDVMLGKVRIAKTMVINNSLNPVWNERFKIEVCHGANTLVFDIRDKDHLNTEAIGIVEINTQMLLNGQMIEDSFPIMQGRKSQGMLQVSVHYKSMMEINNTFEVPSYFPMHRGCGVTLYQDAHCPNHLPSLNLVKGPYDVPHVPQDCWRDLYFAIEGAEHLICITGWSVWVKLRLLRGEEAVAIYGGTLGELLVKKCNEGVRVQIMIWSEASSGAIIGDEGMMGTHDMETYKYFKQDHLYTSHNRVMCALTPREFHTQAELTDMLQNQMSTGTYTHHQKSVIIDSACHQQHDGRRRLVAFVGGLDLTNGRYDNPGHDLFATLKTDHFKDFHNGNVPSVDGSVGPREPWHDIHCQVEGPVARDVLENFIERWSRQASNEGPPPYVDERIINSFAVAQQEDPKNEWNVQLFRSITSDSAMLKEQKRMELMLTSKKGRLVEQSITQAYIQVIRNAVNFIYIENQYFMGSAYNWLEDQSVNCNHTIPCEITTKIINKIRAGERFCAYIVIPMHPEGDPASAPIQAILAWQKRTIEMMYKDIGDALRECNVPPQLGNHPTDWLLFLCPGKREVDGPHMEILDQPIPGTPADLLRRTKRFMIYVHSKMLIVDDTYIIIGSANINERSMAGTRDTEMAVGSWQPHYNQYNPYGDVHMFRMSLFAEHLCSFEETFRFPGTLECVSKVKEMAWYNWQSYNYDQYGLSPDVPTPGQLLMYPVRIEQDGAMNNLDGFVTFPDYPAAAKVFGTKSAMIPIKITT